MMTTNEAEQWVRDNEDGDLDQDELEAAYTAIYGPPDDQARREGLWSHLCAAVPEDESG